MKLQYHKKSREQSEAIGAGGSIKQENLQLTLLKLLILPELGKLEASANSQLSYMFTHCHS